MFGRGPRPARSPAALFAAGLLLACATPGVDRLLANAERYPARLKLEHAPFVAAAEHQCGAAALGVMLGALGRSESQAVLKGEVYVPEREGAFQSDLIAAARRRALLAYPVLGIDELFAELAAGRPVIVMRNRGVEWHELWHYDVAVGFDLPAGTILLHSGEQAFRSLGLHAFERTWARSGLWGLLIVEPGTLPATADEERLLAASVPLERFDRAAAAGAYEALLARFPESGPAWLALGNVRLAEEDWGSAERALARSAELLPDSVPAWNNLAHALAGQGRRAEARVAVERAVALGGPHAEAARATQAELAR